MGFFFPLCPFAPLFTIFPFLSKLPLSELGGPDLHCAWPRVASRSRRSGLAREVGAGRPDLNHTDVTTPALAPHLPQDHFGGSLQVPMFSKGSAGAQFCSSGQGLEGEVEMLEHG